MPSGGPEALRLVFGAAAGLLRYLEDLSINEKFLWLQTHEAGEPWRASWATGSPADVG
jgi:hypothetical protein